MRPAARDFAKVFGFVLLSVWLGATATDAAAAKDGKKKQQPAQDPKRCFTEIKQESSCKSGERYYYVCYRTGAEIGRTPRGCVK